MAGRFNALLDDTAPAIVPPPEHPGIRYLDAGSRAGGQGSSNHVIFDANTIEILRKYGIAGLMAGGAGAAAATARQPQEPPT